MTWAGWMAGAVLLLVVIGPWRVINGLRQRLSPTHPSSDEQPDSGELGRLRRAEIIDEERQRIFSDLHDDIGAKLLDLVHTATSPEQADLARAALQDLRDVVSRSRGAPGTLSQVLGEMRVEAENRLLAGGVQLQWQQQAELPDPPLDQGHALHLYRIVREVISNALRHATPGQVRIRVSALGNDQLLLDITDDGPEPFRPGPETGQGTRSMRSRADALRGNIDWNEGTTGGTKVVLRVPLPDSESG